LSHFFREGGEWNRERTRPPRRPIRLTFIRSHRFRYSSSLGQGWRAACNRGPTTGKQFPKLRPLPYAFGSFRGAVIAFLPTQSGFRGEPIMVTARLWIDETLVRWALVKCNHCSTVDRYPAQDAADAAVTCRRCLTEVDVRETFRAALVEAERDGVRPNSSVSAPGALST
jgi:hypothetical protein